MALRTPRRLCSVLTVRPYEIDLSEENRTKLAQVIAPYIQAGRRVTRGRGRSGNGRQGARRTGFSDVRAWAKENSLKVSERGRISAEVMQKYEAAH
jgi:hypothetical protein